MATTTLEAIRDNMISVIEALTPVSSSGAKFRVDRAVVDFGNWAEEHASSCFRRFAIKDAGGYELPECSDHQEERIRANLVVTVAYPRNQASIVGRAANRDLYDLIREDMHQIDGAIGHRMPAANYVSGQGGTRSLSKDIVEGDQTILLALEVETYFARDMT